MAERTKAPVSKTGVRATVPWVRIPLSPPLADRGRCAGRDDALGIAAGRRGQFLGQQTGDSGAETGFAAVVVRFPHCQGRVVD